MKTYDLIGIGLGPFNLSLAALLDETKNVNSLFLEKKESFSWHSEVMFKDSVMQTSFLKDLVTPISPTNPHSFLNYLVKKGLFYAHLNTERSSVTRREFELYCQWVVENLNDKVSFSSEVTDLKFENNVFEITSNGKTYHSKNICVGTGLTPWVPEFAQDQISATCFHGKSPNLNNLNLNDKKVVVVGGGQTGLEVFRNGFQGKWGKPKKITLISRRHTLEPLDESPFTNEYFSPNYVNDFYKIDNSFKPAIVRHQRFASDGNTPQYLMDLYQELYELKHIHGEGKNIKILPQRRAVNLETHGDTKRLTMFNFFTGETEQIDADVIIFCTGFKNLTPKCLDSISHLINFDSDKRFVINQNFGIDWKHSDTNKIYALNFGRHIHGIAEPQTSLMAWRSGMIVNDLLNEYYFPTENTKDNFTQHGRYSDD